MGWGGVEAGMEKVSHPEPKPRSVQGQEWRGTWWADMN